ncbi:MAG: hypothetical protein GQ574_17205 [Crocinitomix sp.]|nr:hypothetical protein [Crocinitomix sp.]
MKKSKLAYKLFTLSAAFLMLSCGGENHDETNEVNVVDTAGTGSDENFEDLFESPEIDYHLPSPLQVASIFKKSGLSYNSDATSKPDLVENYTTELNQMLNFGVYSADMAYCVLNEQSNEGRKYLQVITDLAEKIGMEAVFENKDLMERFDTNIEDKDSIEVLMIDIHERTEMYMDENDMQHQQAVHFAGAWTEGMYLGVYDFENNPEKDGVGTQIAEQMSILGNIIKGLADPKNDGMDIEWLIADMGSIENTFNEFESVNNYYEDPDAEELVLTTVEYNTLSELIKTLRTKITNG